MLEVRLLGELAVKADGQDVALADSWRARSLLAWLALNPGTHLRGDLAARFWPDVLDTSARASLRNALWALRRELGPAADVLIATRERVGLEGAWTDVEEFERLVTAGDLDAAVALWTAEPLSGLDDDWAYEARDELTRRVSGVLDQLAVAAETAGDHQGAVAWTRRRVALDPLAEDAQRELIRRLADCGDRTGALDVYAKLQERLRRDLGISPSGATRELVERIRDEPASPVATIDRGERVKPRPAPAGEPGKPPGLPPRLRLERSVRLIGRTGELEQLEALLARARKGGARLALITGEPGIGKSRLAQELGIRAHGAGAIVLHGACEEDTIAPYEPFAEALGEWSLDLSARERHEAFEAVADLLASLARDTPVVLVIDDLHWADASSAGLLRYVLCARPETALLVVATYRRGEVARDTPVPETLSRLNQDGLLDRLDLPGLDRNEVDALVRELAGATPSAGVTAAVHAETEGNPFFVGEIARQLGDDVAAHRLVLPDSVRELIERRLLGISEPCLRLLTVAAVIGFEFPLAPLERTSDLTPAELDEALEEAIAAGLIVELPSLEDRLAFTHTLIRRTIIDRLARSRRRRLHARIAEALETPSATAATEDVVAYHLCEAGSAGDPAKAVEYASRVGEQAAKRRAYADAVQIYTRVLPLLPEDDPRRRKIALKRAIAYQALGHQFTGDA